MKPEIRLPFIFIVLVLLMIPKMLPAQQTTSSAVAPNPEISDHIQRVIASKPGDLFVVLKNGLTVLIHKIEDSQVASTRVFVRAGSIYEGRYMNGGLSHYLEHVVSGGTTSFFTEEAAKDRLERIGGASNAFTSFDRTVYFIDTAAQHWQEAVDLLLAYVFHSTLEPKEVVREKPVIQQEMKMGENDPDRELWKLFMETAYRSHPVRFPVIGFEQVFVQQDRNALVDYYRERYHPGNVLVVVSGGVEPENVLRFIQEKTRDIQRKPEVPIVLPEEPAQVGERRQEKELPFARLTQAIMGFPSVALQDRDLYALDVLAVLMGQGRSSRLHNRLKEEENKVLSVSASNWTPGYVKGQFMISVSLAPQYWPDILGSVEEEIQKFKTSQVSRAELDKAKKIAVAQHIYSQDTASELASSIGSSYYDTGDPYFDGLYVDNIRKVTAAEIQAVARKYLLKDRMNTAVIQPPDASAKPEAAGLPREKVSQPKDRQEIETLSNGLKVLIKEDHALPMVTLQLYGLGGLYFEAGEKPGIAAFTSSLLTAGTETRSKLEISRSIEEVGGALQSRSDNSTYHVSMKVLKEDLDLALDVLSDVVQHATFPKEEIEKRRKETLLTLPTLDESWQMEVLRLFRNSYFAQSPYKNERIGTQESVEAITREDILRFYKRMVNPRRSVLAVYGDVDSNRLRELIKAKLAGWKGEDAPLPDFKPETANIDKTRVVEKRNDKTASAILVAANGLDIDSKSKPILDVLDAVLSGKSYPGGRLFNRLRGGNEDLVYVVGGFPFYGKKAGFYGVLTQTTLANADKVKGIIESTLEEVMSTPIPDEELEKTKDLVISMNRLELESLEAQAQNAAVNESLGLGWDYDSRYPELVRQVTGGQIQQLAGELFANFLVVKTIPEHPVDILEAPPMKSDVQSN